MEDRSLGNVGAVLVGFALAAAAVLWSQPSSWGQTLPWGQIQSWSVTLSLVGGVGGVIAAYGDGRGLQSLGPRVMATLRSMGIAVAGFLAMILWGNVLLSFASLAVAGEVGRSLQYAISTLALGFGSGSVALGYFYRTDKTLSFLDVGWPSWRDVGYAVGGVVGLILMSNVVSVVFNALGMGVADHSVEQVAMGNPEILLLMIPAAWLIIGPGEELIYRSIIQKSLYDTFSKWGAVAVASVVFALVHIPTYALGASSVVSVVNTLVVIFLLSMILGGTYLRTRNVVVPIFIHGTYDVLSFLSIYFQITSGSAAFVLP